MIMRRKWYPWGLAISLAAIFMHPSPVEAKRIFVFTFGDTISHVADVPAPVRKGKLGRIGKLAQVLDNGIKPAVGFRYSYFGIVYLDLWTWGGKHCLYVGKTSWDKPLPEIANMLGIAQDELGKPWYYTFPPGLLVIAGFVVIAVVVGMVRKSPESKVKELLKDPRYQKALQVLHEESAKEEAKAYAQSENEAQIADIVPAEAAPP